MAKEIDIKTEKQLQSKLNYLKQQLNANNISRKKKKQFEHDLESTALELAKIKIQKNKHFGQNVIYNPKDPPLPTKELQTSNLELFSLNEINAEKTEKGLHKKLKFLHSKSIHNIDNDEFMDNESASNSASSSSKSSSTKSFQNKILNFDNMIQINRIDINTKSRSLKRSNSLPKVPTINHSDYTLQQFNPPNLDHRIPTNWWIERLYDVNGFFVYQPQSLCMPTNMIPRLYGNEKDDCAHSELILINEQYSDQELEYEYDISDQENVITSARSEPEKIRIRRCKPLVPRLNISSDSNSHSVSNCKRGKSGSGSESPPLWIEPKVNDEISPDEDSGFSLHEVLDEKRKRKSERKKRKQKLIEQLNNKPKQKRHRRSKKRQCNKRCHSVDGRMKHIFERNKLNQAKPVTEHGLSKREKFRRQYAHLLEQ